MFCKNCGAQISDGAKFCGVCGASQQDAPQAAPTNTNAASASAPAALNLGAINIKSYLKYILVGIAVLALIFAIMNIFNTYEVKATVSYGGEKISNSGPVKDLFGDEFDGKFTMLMIGNILFGVVNLVVAAVGVLFFLKENNNMDLYDKYIAKYTKGKSPLFVVGVLGAVAGLVQVLCYAVSQYSLMGAKMTVAAHWTTWVGLILYVACAVVDKFVLNEKN